MLQIQTILCPVDFSPLSDRTLQLAAALCERFGARLVLQHNLDSRPPGFLSVSWMWSEDHETDEEARAAAAPGRLRELLAGLPHDIQKEAKLTRGPLDRAVLEVAEVVAADLIVLGSHGWGDAGHQSMTEDLIRSAPCTVLTTNEDCDLDHWLKQQIEEPVDITLLVPVDLEAGSDEALAFVASMDTLPEKIHVMYVVEGVQKGFREIAEQARKRLDEMIPESLSGRVCLDVRFGAIADSIVHAASQHDAHFIVMASHAKGIFSRLLIGDRAPIVLHGAPCPVWFVPVNRRWRDARIGTTKRAMG